jgi:hypothetical protein
MNGGGLVGDGLAVDVGQPCRGVGGLLAAALDDAGGDDPGGERVGARALDVEASQSAEVPAHEAPPWIRSCPMRYRNAPSSSSSLDSFTIFVP